MISLDTVRRDHLTSYGYGRDTMPRLDALARQSAVFDNAYAQDTNTNPSHASMFTGLYPHVHGSRYNGQCLNDGELTLAEILEESGYATGAFVSGFTMTARASCLDQGFARYDDNFDGHRRDGWTTTDLALEWLDERRNSEPYFLFLHLYDAHGPYLPPGNYSKLFASHDPGPPVTPPNYQTVAAPGHVPEEGLNGYVDRYDGMLRFMDDALDVLLDSIDLERTVVVVLADHGETLGERHRQLDHGGQVFDEQIGIPLVIHAPGMEHRRIGAAVE
ncbi:MAG: sulfatase, partial [Actinobacteria bacterium]|nr:sulfatase [Actinomycetota bacterium]NIV87494.1 sulfatase-like hydrolase/transferase [Actinomycetota bacterium]